MNLRQDFFFHFTRKETARFSLRLGTPAIQELKLDEIFVSRETNPTTTTGMYTMNGGLNFLPLNHAILTSTAIQAYLRWLRSLRQKHELLFFFFFCLTLIC